MLHVFQTAAREVSASSCSGTSVPSEAASGIIAFKVALTAAMSSPSMAKVSTVSNPASAANLHSSDLTRWRPNTWRTARSGTCVSLYSVRSTIVLAAENFTLKSFEQNFFGVKIKIK